MKKFFTLLVVFVLVFTMTASIFVSAEDEATAAPNDGRTLGAGGLDFYSITIHYESPILLNYYSLVNSDKTKTNLFFNPKITDGDKFVDDKNKSLMADKVIIGGNTSGDYYVVQYKNSKDPSVNIYPDITASSKPKKFAFYNHIQDGNVLMQVESTDFYGLTAPYDEGAAYVNQNPNVIYGSDGYALAVEQDADGNAYRIDINGYAITANNIWISQDGRRCELFVNIPVLRKTGAVNKKGVPVTEWANSDTYMALDFNARFDENGKIINLMDIKNVFYIPDADFEAFLADETRNTITPSPYTIQTKRSDYQTEDEYTKAVNSEIKALGKTGEYYTKSYAQLFKTKFAEGLTDTNKDGVIDQLDDTTYYTREVTADDILYAQVEGKSIPVNGTPIIATPQVTVKIKDITVEIDALGSQIYSDLSSDPQQQNEIIVTLNDCLSNINFYDRCLRENRITQEQFDAMGKVLLGSVKSVTTKTEMQDVKTDSGTVKSLSLGLTAEQLAAISRSPSTIFINFSINTHQPDAAYSQFIEKKNYLVTDFSPVSIQVKTDADLPDVIPQPKKGGCGSSAAIAQVMLVLGAAVVIKRKKK